MSFTHARKGPEWLPAPGDGVYGIRFWSGRWEAEDSSPEAPAEVGDHTKAKKWFWYEYALGRWEDYIIAGVPCDLVSLPDMTTIDKGCA
jgi:hypothetical protein